MFARWKDLVNSALVRASGARSPRTLKGTTSQPADLQAVCRGWYVESAALEIATTRWEREELALTVRILALQRIFGTVAVFAGPAAAFVQGLPVYPLLGVIEVLVPYRPSSRSRALPPLRWADGTVVAGVAMRRRQMWRGLVDEVSPEVELAYVAGAANAAWSAAHVHPISAFVIASAVYRQLSAFDRDDPEGSRTRENVVRDLALEAARVQDGRVNSRSQVEWILRNADAGCESPGESRTLFALRGRGVIGQVTQRRIVVRGRTRYVDICNDKARVATEYEGETKDGATVGDVHEAQAEREQRDLELGSVGWAVVHVRKRAVGDGDRLLADHQAVARGPLSIDPAAAFPGIRQLNGRPNRW